MISKLDVRVIAMTPKQVALVQDSFAKVALTSEAAAVLFYHRLFDIAPIDALRCIVHRFPQSAVYEQGLRRVHLTPCPPWSMLSTRMRERSHTESRRTDRRL